VGGTVKVVPDVGDVDGEVAVYDFVGARLRAPVVVSLGQGSAALGVAGVVVFTRLLGVVLAWGSRFRFASFLKWIGSGSPRV
jgi:hypothetical protein